MGMPLHVPSPNMVVFHGVLMVSGFLGTVIVLERSTALGWGVGNIFALLSGLGALIVGIGWNTEIGIVMVVIAGFGLISMYIFIISKEFTWHTFIMLLGSVLWFLGSIFWLRSYPFTFTANLWAGFLVLTVIGERIELSRIIQTSGSQRAIAGLLSTIFMIGLLINYLWVGIGVVTSALALVALSIWLLKNDLARYTVSQAGLPKYMAICLISGFIWLIVGACASILYMKIPDHLYYDAYLHSIFLGFIFSMIFAHTPVIFPSLTGMQVGFYDRFYIHYLLLQGSLIIRLIGDFVADGLIREIGGSLNGLAIVFFLISTIVAVFQTNRLLRSQQVMN